jgi:hypothetical protein
MSNAGTLSPTEIMALVVLMAESREIRNPDLKALSGVDLSGRARTNLLRLGLISERKVNKANAFSLTPAGWATGLELVADHERLGGTGGGALSVLIRAIHRSLQQHGLSPEKFFEPAAEPSAAQEQEQEQAKAAEPEIAGDPETQVRAAYARLSPHTGAWVSLADVREALPALSRAEVDSGLRVLARTPGAQLIPVANLKALTQRDRDAAIKLGGEDNHVLSIEAA